MTWALAVVAGVLSCIAFPSVGVWPLAFVSISPLFFAIDGLTPKRAFLHGWVAGTVGYLGVYWWLVDTISVFGDLPWLFGVFCYVLLCVYIGLSWGLVCVFLTLLRDRESGQAPFWWIPICFCAVEWAWWTVFPSYFGASLYKVPFLMQGADLGSVLACTFLVLLANGLATEAIRFARKRPHALKRAAIATGAFTALWLVYCGVRWSQYSSAIASARQLKVGMVQSNIGGLDKRGFGDEMTVLHQEASRSLEAKGAELILWPETAYPHGIHLRAKNLRRAVGLLETPVVFGAVTVDDDDKQYNTAFLVDAQGDVRGYSHKVYMLPFGEFLPFGETFPQLYDLIPAIARLTPGEKALPMSLDDMRFATVICYEDILPYFVRRAALDTDPHLLLNITNDSWFGDSPEQEIHLALASFRAVEMRRGLVRSTNTGISAIVDPLGRITTRSGRFVREDVLGDVPVLLRGTSLYRIAGDWLGWACSAMVLGVLWGRYRARRKATSFLSSVPDRASTAWRR